MRIWSIAEKEIIDIVSDRKYMVSLAIQLLLLLAIIPAFSSYLAEEGFRLPAPTMKNFVPMGLIDHSGRAPALLNALQENERLVIERYEELSIAREDLSRGRLAALLIVEEDYDEGSLKRLSLTLYISASSIKAESARDAIERSLRDASNKISAGRRADVGVESASIFVKRKFLRPVVIEREGSRYSSFFLGYLIPIVLFFPIFMSSSLIVDSVVGEKERKTIEPLLAAPLKRSWILYGKFIAIFGFITLQVLVWLVALTVLGIAIGSIVRVFLLLAAVNLALTTTAFLLATYSRNVKEANILMMLLYVFVFVSLITSLSLEFFNPRSFFEFIPFNTLSRLATGEGVHGLTYISMIVVLGAYSSLMFSGAVRLIERDDIVYGPRPSPMILLTDIVAGVMRRFAERPAMGVAVVAFASGMMSIPLALFLEISGGIIILYTFGYDTNSLFLMVALFALIEETLKPIGLYALQRSDARIDNPASGAFYGALSGLGFFAVENAFIIFFLLFSVPSMISWILALRTGSTMIIHLISSGIVGIGLTKKRGSYGLPLRNILLATSIHAFYNLALVMLV
ncbi:MAG: ABC transporter permease [Candidatus Hydrothermarchaeaceae archaeon]